MPNKKLLIRCGASLLGCVAAVAIFKHFQGPPPATSAAALEVPRIQVELRDGLLRDKQHPETPFTGSMVETAVGGKLLTQVSVVSGKIHGLSKGWHENGQPEVEETFLDGVSHGPRLRWHANGQKKSVGTIVNGQFHGLYREWHDNGQLALTMTLDHGKGEGVSESWWPDGSKKSTAELKNGEATNQQYFANQTTLPE